MAQKRKFYVKTANGVEEQLIASSADIVSVSAIEGLDADNVQEALEELHAIAKEGGVTGVKGENESEYRQGQVNITKDNIGLGNVSNDAQVKRTEMGVASGVATLDTTGRVPSSQLPSYVDDVVIGYYNAEDNEFYSSGSFAESSKLTAEWGKIYVDENTNKTYRYCGVPDASIKYVEISSSLALGETSSTAYAGDKGKANADAIADILELMGDAITDIGDIKDGNIKVKKAESTDKLATARKISLEGDATGTVDFDGSADVSITATLANTGVNAGTYSAVAVDAKGRVTAGSQIIEWGTSGQTLPTSNLAVGGLFFALVE